MSQICFDKIVIPLDGSENSLRALSYACYLAENCNASLELLYVALMSKEISAYAQITSSYIPDAVFSGAQENGHKILQEGLKQVPSSLSVNCSLEIGCPPEKIIEFSEGVGTGLIVMGSRGLSALKGILVGSVSSYVMHHAKIPVMIVK